MRTTKRKPSSVISPAVHHANGHESHRPKKSPTFLRNENFLTTMKNLYYLLKRNADSGKPVYHQWLRSGLIGRGRGFSESSDPDFAFRTENPIEILVHYEYLRTEIHSPYEWELVAYMMDNAQRSWADQSPAAEYRNVLPPTESIEAWKRRMAYDPALMKVYTAKLDELRKNYV